MLSEKPWSRETLLLLVAGLMISWCFGLLLGILLEQFIPLDAAAKKSFYHFVIGTLTFHGAGLVMVHQFLKLHGMSWREFLGLKRPHLMRAVLFAVVIAAL